MLRQKLFHRLVQIYCAIRQIRENHISKSEIEVLSCDEKFQKIFS